jgi:hypothetical protein
VNFFCDFCKPKNNRRWLLKVAQLAKNRPIWSPCGWTWWNVWRHHECVMSTRMCDVNTNVWRQHECATSSRMCDVITNDVILLPILFPTQRFVWLSFKVSTLTTKVSVTCLGKILPFGQKKELQWAIF